MSDSNGQGTLPTGNAYQGWANVQTGGALFNSLDFLTRQIVKGKAFSALVQVIAVHGGGVGSPATVDVQPAVNQVDGAANQTPHGTVHGMACFRLQGGNGAVILDPVVGDIGMAIICDRDISVVKATGAISGPGSFRTNDWADGCYFGAILGGTPARYAHLSNLGTALVDPLQISLTVGGFGVTITASGTTIDGVPFLPHEHTLVQIGVDDSGPVKT
jgi:hypothetical protein